MIYVLSIFIVASVGALGNTLILCVLSQSHMHNTFNKLRAALAVFDTVYLGAILLGESILLHDKEMFGKIFPHFLWPTRNFSQTASMFMTVAIAIERLMAIKYLHQYDSNERHRATKYVLGVTITAMVLNLTKFNEYQTDASGQDNWSKQWGITATSMLKNMGYAIYDNAIFKLLIAGLIPIAMLVYSYAKIFLILRKNAQRIENSRSKSTIEDNNTSGQENMARLFAGVVVTSLICNIPEMVVKVSLLILTVKYPGTQFNRKSFVFCFGSKNS